MGDETISCLTLPSDNPEYWEMVCATLGPTIEKLSDLDQILTKFASLDREPRVCTFFHKIPGSSEGGEFDFDTFFKHGVPLLVQVALEMPKLFEGVVLPIYKMRSTWKEPKALTSLRFTLSRRQCACLLAHSFFGSLKRPSHVQPNDFRFTAVDLFMGTAVSPISAVTFLNYFAVVGKRGFPSGDVTFERIGYPKGAAPWTWDGSEKALSRVELVCGSIDDCDAEMHAEFANAFVGGGVMTGDVAMEEILFLVKPELMVAMALQNRMVDEEVVRVHGAVKYSRVNGFGSSMQFAGDCGDCVAVDPARVAAVCAIDAVRGGGPAASTPAQLRDMNKARIAFDGVRALASGHWGCGAYGNNHDMMFLKQWLAASEAGVACIYYHDFSKLQSHHILPLHARLKHLNVGQLWRFLNRQICGDLQPFDMPAFSMRIADVAVGRIKPNLE
jgi:hypothetical protein